MRSTALSICIRSKQFVSLIPCFFLFASSFGHAQNDFFSSISTNAARNNSKNGEDYSVIAWVTQKVSQGLEQPSALFSRTEKEINKIETSLFAQLDGDFGEQMNFRISGKIYHDEIYRLNSGATYSENERNEFRNRFEIKDFYIEHQSDDGWYFKLGNQILAWGLSEYLRVTDMINTEDQFTFGQQDLEDLRLQVPAALLSYTVGTWVFDSVLTYRAGKDDTAPAGNEFDQLITLRDSGVTLQRIDPSSEYESFFRASTHYSRGDFQFVAGEFNDNALSVDQIVGPNSINPQLSLGQNRMRAMGVAANWVEGSWLLFGEAGVHYDKAVRPAHESFLQQLDGWDEKDQLLTVLGVEYNGFRNLLLSVELDNVHTEEHDIYMLGEEDQTSLGARLYWTALNERLQVLAVWNELADNSGRVSRVSVDYNWSDNLDLGLMWVDYSSENDSIFYNFRNNDVLQLNLRYNFQI